MIIQGLWKGALLGAVFAVASQAFAEDAPAPGEGPAMKYGDTSRRGRSFTKDPAVVRFKDKYFLYYSIPPSEKVKGWGIGIAQSGDLTNWNRIGEIAKSGELEKNGFCAPGATVLNGKVHLFYQTYGNREKDAICHAFSADGVRFERNPTNPIFRPTGDWNCGRAIDADVIAHDGKLWLYWATRDPSFKKQLLGVATAPLDSDFGRAAWTQRCDAPILSPELPWEKRCIEAAALFKRDGKLHLFYAGAYNNEPQQIGCAASDDGIVWKRLTDKPILPNGKPGEWNSSESGHPFAFTDDDGQLHLFFQGNNDKGKTWFLSRKKIEWKNGLPAPVEP